MQPDAPSLQSLSAVIFDVDGVLVASPHERAWREAPSGMTSIWIARLGDAALLRAGGGLVVTSLEQVDMQALTRGRLAVRTE